MTLGAQIADLAHVRAALKLPDARTVSEWVDANVVLTERTGTAAPGRFRTSRTPYLREIQDAFADGHVEQITLVASTQVGKTTCMLNACCWAIDQAPGPAMIVLPQEDIATRFSRTRLRPQIEGSPAVAAHLPDNKRSIKQQEYHLDRMTILFAWATSPSVLASQPICYLFLDEVDKFPAAASAIEADPMKLARERTRTFWNRKVVVASTPTTSDGVILREWETSDQRRYWMPCPHCSMRLLFEFAQLKWPKNVTADQVKGRRLAYYECPHCHEGILDRHKNAMLARGQWLQENPDVDDPGHRGYRLNALYSPWLTFSEVAAEFLSARESGRREELQNFVNSWLAEPFEDQVTVISGEKLNERVENAARQRGEVPDDVQLVTVGVDWHGYEKGLYWSALGFAPGRHAYLLDYGLVYTLQDLEEQVWRKWGELGIGALVGADSGWDTPQVYRWCQRWWPRARPTKGKDWLEGSPVRDFAVDYADRRSGRKFRGFSGTWISTGFYKDELARLLQQTDEDSDGPSPQFDLCRGVEREFLRHLRAEHKVRVKGKEVWQPQRDGLPNHWLDTVVIALALGDRYGAGRLLKPEPAGSVHAKARKEERDRAAFRTPDGRPYLITQREK